MVSCRLFSFREKFSNYAVKIQNLTVKQNAPFQIQNFKLLFFFSHKNYCNLVVFLVVMYKTFSDWR